MKMGELSVRVHLVEVEASAVSQRRQTSLEDYLVQFCAPEGQSESEIGPPAKRRRITQDDKAAQQSGEQLDQIVLADLTLILNSGRQFIQNSYFARERTVNVIKCSKNKGNNSVQFHLSWSGPTLEVTEASDEVTNILWWASVIGRDSKKFMHIAFCDSILKPPSSSCDFFKLQIRIKWKIGASTVFQKATLLDQLLATYLPGLSANPTPWSPQDFYESVHVPDHSIESQIQEQTIGLRTQLYPFQGRALKWLLEREGVQHGHDGTLDKINSDVEPLSYHPTTDALDRRCYVSYLTGEVALKHIGREDQIRGGILAEEMGLGKTVELIALILSHKRPTMTSSSMIDSYTGDVVVPSAATLIITPPTILEQWISELKTHAPSLRVLHYKGVRHSKLSDEDLTDELLRQDIVLTTYAVLANEIHYAKQTPKRDLRHEKKYEARRTPLIKIHWWRTCLDEAQMVESGVSNAAQVARLIPRHNAWAISGTPLKKDVKDLLGLLVFLRYSPFCYESVWNRLIKDYKPIFVELFGKITMRQTKATVSEELHLPPQKRVVISIPFTAIEEQNYSQIFQQMCDQCGLDAEGGPLREDWDPMNSSTIEKMRSWLTRLRQTCLHAEIGASNRRALGRGNGPLRTVEEVLEVLIDQNETSLRAEERAVLTSKIMQGHVLSFGKDRNGALELYLNGLKEATIVVEECREQLTKEEQKVEQNKLAMLADALKKTNDTDFDADNDDVEELTGRLNVAKQRLRAALEMKHMFTFFSATAYFQLKESLPRIDNGEERIKELESQESTAYERAKSIRKELLTEVTQKTTQLVSKVSTVRSKSLAVMPTIKVDGEMRGIESRKIFEAVEDLANILNDQTKEVQDVRNKLVELLTARLLDQDEEMEMTGDEYETSTKQQDEQYALHTALRAAHADRHGMISGEINLLIKIEMNQALKLAMNGTPLEPEQKGPAPELMVAMLGRRERMFSTLQQLSKRNNLPADTQISMRGIIAEARSMLTSLQWQESGRSNRAIVEASILERELNRLQSISAEQVKALVNLEKEIDLYRTTMNQRLEFYKQLQQISDTVAPLQEEENDKVDVQRLDGHIQKERTQGERLAVFKTKRRFLNHLRTESSGHEDQRVCVICQGSFEIGVLTVCGHQYCKECISLWWNSRGTCPTCKRHLKRRDFHDVTYKPQHLQVMQEEHSNSADNHLTPNGPTSFVTSTTANPKARSTTTTIYTTISPQTLASIKSTSLRINTSYGTKIDTISRHLLHLRITDTGAKSIIFSQYRDFLTVLASAFDAFRIGHTSIGAKNGIARFRDDPSVECFLMHAKADSSGLNLVNATHVFLCEPLINPALELQAIARVHRIGQRRPTTVWMYLVSDTVEQAIYEISVSRRLAHLQRDHKQTSTSTSCSASPSVEEKTLDIANSLEMQRAPVSELLSTGKGSGEVVEVADLWNCLFGSRAGRRGASELAHREVSRFLREEAAEGRRG